MNCSDCGEEIKNYHPYAHYENLHLDSKTKNDKFTEKNLCQKCSISYIDRFKKYQPGKLYIE